MCSCERIELQDKEKQRSVKGEFNCLTLSVYKAFKSLLSISMPMKCEEVSTFSSDPTHFPLSMCMILSSRKFLGLGINGILSRTVHSISTCTLRIRMDLESITLYFSKKDLSAVAIHAEINSVLGEGMIGYSTVTH
jgi:hypothetical protein